MKRTILIQTNKGIKHLSLAEAEVMYLDYVNNFLTLEKFAEHYSISFWSAQRIYNTMKIK